MMMIEMVLSLLVMIFLLVLIVLFFIYYYDYNSPKSYPLLGCTLSLVKNWHHIIQWTTDLLAKSSSSTITLTGLFGQSCILTSNPSNVKHILKTRFNVYQKDSILRRGLIDLLGCGIFLVDGTEWKSQRQLMSHEFRTDTFLQLVESITMKELSTRLLPLFSSAHANAFVLDLQEIFGRFTFDMVCQVAFGYDPHYLLPSLKQNSTPLADAYRTAIKMSMGRCISPPIFWKVKKFFNIGSEKKLSLAVHELRKFIRSRIIEKKEALLTNNSVGVPSAFFDRMLAKSDDHKNKSVFDENFYIDEAINLILGAEDTLCSALVWYFWLVSSNPQVEKEIVREILQKEDCNNLKEMVYMHASICESMRLYPPVPQESKQAMKDDIWPDGTKVKKGTRVLYNIFAMGRSPKLWGESWADFEPERRLERDDRTGNWRFIPKDPFTYPMFQAGPRTCIGKEIAFMQMKLVATIVLRRFQIEPAVEGYSPVYGSCMTSMMRNGFPVQILQRCQNL
ncbi:cytochrome 94A1-like [Capsicum annuum]